MKFLIAHRGNMNGINHNKENHPEYIKAALSKGYYVEIDVWKINSELFLGHDKPQYKISKEFLQNEKLWCHAKNIEALSFMKDNNIHCFFHNNDDYTLTSRGYIWAYIGKEVDKNTICVLPEKNEQKIDFNNCLGICSDYICLYS